VSALHTTKRCDPHSGDRKIYICRRQKDSLGKLRFMTQHPTAELIWNAFCNRFSVAQKAARLFDTMPDGSVSLKAVGKASPRWWCSPCVGRRISSPWMGKTAWKQAEMAVGLAARDPQIDSPLRNQ